MLLNISSHMATSVDSQVQMWMEIPEPLSTPPKSQILKQDCYNSFNFNWHWPDRWKTFPWDTSQVKLHSWRWRPMITSEYWFLVLTCTYYYFSFTPPPPIQPATISLPHPPLLAPFCLSIDTLPWTASLPHDYSAAASILHLAVKVHPLCSHPGLLWNINKSLKRETRPSHVNGFSMTEEPAAHSWS